MYLSLFLSTSFSLSLHRVFLQRYYVLLLIRRKAFDIILWDLNYILRLNTMKSIFIMFHEL